MSLGTFQVRRRCGPHDKRRKSHRCENCRRSHIKCDGSRPCSACRSRTLRCDAVSSVESSSDLAIVVCQPPASVSPGIGMNVHLHDFLVTKFYNLVGRQYSPLMNGFTREITGSICGQVEPVRRAMCALGAVIAAGECSHSDPSLQQRFLATAQATYIECCSYLQRKTCDSSATGRDNGSFLCGLLLSIFHLMTDASTTRWYLMTKCTLQRIVQLRGPESFSSPVALAIFNQYWVLESLRTLAFDEDNTLADPKWLSLLGRAEESSTREVATQRDQTRLLRCMALLGRLNYRSLIWLERARAMRYSNSLPTHNISSLRDSIHFGEGKDIIQEGHMVRQELLQLAPDLHTYNWIQARSLFDLMMSLYHCGLISLSRLFIDPLWSILGEPLPMLPEDAIRYHAIAALEHLQRRLQVAGMESVFFLPLLTTVALEVRSRVYRDKVSRIFDSVEGKGFAVAATARSDVQLAWALVGSSGVG